VEEENQVEGEQVKEEQEQVKVEVEEEEYVEGSRWSWRRRSRWNSGCGGHREKIRTISKTASGRSDTPEYQM
jgi:hypothetical protein